MNVFKRLVSTILSLALCSAAPLAHAGERAARLGSVTGAPVAVAALNLPSVNVGLASGLKTPVVGADLAAPAALSLPGAAASAATKSAASSAQAVPGLPQIEGAASQGSSAVQLPAVSIGEAAQAPAALPEAKAEAAVEGFAASVSGRANGRKLGGLARSLFGWLKPRSAEVPAVPAVQAMSVGEGVDGGHATLTAAPASDDQAKDGSGSSQEPPAPPSNGGGDGGGSKSVWRNAGLFIFGLVIAQVGVEAWSASWAKWVQVNYGLDAYSNLTMIGMVVSLAAGYAGGWAADKFGLKRTYIATTVLFAAAAAATLFLFKAGALTLPLLIGLAAFRTFVGGAGRTAEQTIPIAIFKDNKAALGRYNSVSQFILEFAGIGVPFMIGTLLGMFGSIGTMMILPITAALAAIVYMFVKMGEVKKEKKNLSGPAKPDPKLLRIGMMTYPALALINFLLYAIIAIGYGNFLHPGDSLMDQAAAAGVAGKIVSLYSVGGLIAAAMLSGIPGMVWGWLKKRFPKVNGLAARFAKPGEEVDDHTAQLRSTSKWLFGSALAMAAFIPMLWTSPLLAALAMIPFGVANVMSTLQLMTLVQQNAPQEKKGKIIGGLRTITTLASTAGLFGFSWLFKHYPASTMPFMVMLGVFAAIGVYYVVMSRKLTAASKNPPAQS